MRHRIYGLLMIFVGVCTGCHTVHVQKQAMNTSISTPEALGVIGLQKEHLLFADFNGVALPKYKESIRVKSSTVPFTSSSYSAYSKISPSNDFNIKYVDSIEKKPEFAKLEILDRVGVIKALETCLLYTSDAADD